MPRRGRSGGGDGEATEVLRLIWGELKSLGKNLGGRIDQTNARLDQTNARLDQTNARLEGGRIELDTKIEELRRTMVESDVRLATSVTNLANDIHALTGYLREHRADDQRITSCESEIETLKRRVGTLEAPGRR